MQSCSQATRRRLRCWLDEFRRFRGRARMAELVDACTSQVHARKGVWIRTPLRARPQISIDSAVTDVTFHSLARCMSACADDKARWTFTVRGLCAVLRGR